MRRIRLGINIDHIATLRNARDENDPSLLEMLFEVQAGGADLITMHLREDRRHIKDEDIFEIKKHGKLPLNLEMALIPEMIEIACELRPSSVCLVPEKREEVTTEGGLDIKKIKTEVQEAAALFQKKSIQLFLFIDPNEQAVMDAREVGATGIEVHTGGYARAFSNQTLFEHELDKIKKVAELCHNENISFHAGHGLNYHNIIPLLGIENLTEVNIGHAVIAHSLKAGLRRAVSEMKNILLGR